MRVQMVAHKSDKALKAEHQKCKILIMTSAQNHVETVMFFRSKKFFGYQESSFVFFQQGELPAVYPDGKIVMKANAEPAMSPNGNGAFFEALNSNEKVRNIVAELKYVQVIGVDNVLNRLLCPL